jgi:hypothetical protein
VGEYGYEDIINPAASNGVPDGALAPSEDVNENDALEVYGKANLGDGFNATAQGTNHATNDRPDFRINCLNIARKNRVSGARHGLKLVDGTLGNLPTIMPADTGGFTVASENPVYVQGNYNASTADGFDDPHSNAAVIADAVSLLSRSWRDIRSWKHPFWVGTGSLRDAVSTYYRAAIAAGKNRNWPHPSWTSAEDYGLDGGTHNFLRYLERWGGETLFYRGSLVSLYFAEYGNGIYKCCNTVYTPPTRNYQFDTDFLDPDRLPPGTPRFRDVTNVGFRQVFNPE